MENGKKIIIPLVLVLVLAIGGFYAFSGGKKANYEYKLAGQTGSTMTGTIENTTPTEALAYLSTWNGDVKRAQK